MKSLRFLPFVAIALFSASCGGDSGTTDAGPNNYSLSGDSPFPTGLRLGGRVRNLWVTYETRTGAGGRDTQCGLTALLFDVTNGFTVVAAGIEGECRFYATPPDAEYAGQRFVCAGSIGVQGADLTEQIGFCPTGMMPVYVSRFPQCRGLSGGAMLTVSSVEDGVPGDAVTDLTANVTLPSNVDITNPSLPQTTWPADGDLVVNWTSANATSAFVRVYNPSAPDPVIWCSPHTNGTVRVPAGLIAQGNFRTRDATLQVISLRDTMVMAEGGRTYRVAGATASNASLLARH